MVGASVALRVGELLGIIIVDAVFANSGGVVGDFEELDDSLAEIKSLLNGASDAGLEVGREDETVHDNFNVVLDLFF